MTRTRRRWLASTLAVLLVATAGCGGLGGDTTTTTYDPQAGYVQAEAVDSAPENETVVDYASGTVGDSERLATALGRAVDSNETVYVPLEGDEIDRAYDALNDVPRGDDAYQYVRYDDTVVKVVVAVNQDGNSRTETRLLPPRTETLRSRHRKRAAMVAGEPPGDAARDRKRYAPVA